VLCGLTRQIDASMECRKFGEATDWDKYQD